jgi:molybdate transport system regulatory protein
VPLSARNQLSGTVRSVETDGLVAEVTIELDGGETVTSVITSNSVDRLGIAEGEAVDAVVKATEVMVQRE